MRNNLPPMSLDFQQQMLEMQSFAENMKREENQALKKMFGNRIKQSFLIEIKERVSRNPEYVMIAPKIYDLFNFSTEKMLVGTDNPSFDICKHITMIHYVNTVLLNDGERGSLQSDEKYKKKLEEQVLLQIKLKSFGEVDFTKDSIDSFLPLIYITNVIGNYLIYSLTNIIKSKSKVNQKNYVFKMQILWRIANKIRACCKLIDGRLIEEAYNPLRSMIELVMIFLTIGQDENRSSEYMKFVEYQNEYQNTTKIPKELQDKYNSRFQKDTKVSIVDYMNFGWLDSIFEFGYIDEKEKKYKIHDVALLLDMVYKNNKLGSNLYKFYRECNTLSHGVIKGVNIFMSRVTICKEILFVLDLIKPILKELFDLEFVYSNIDFFEYAMKASKEIDKILKALEINPKLNEKLNEGNYLSII